MQTAHDTKTYTVPQHLTKWLTDQLLKAYQERQAKR
jgi:hypothetical protein